MALNSVGNVTVKKDNLKNILKNIGYFKKKVAYVGVPESENARTNIENYNQKVEAANKAIKEQNKIKSQKALRRYLERSQRMVSIGAPSGITRRFLKASKKTYRAERKGVLLGKKTIGNAELAYMFEYGTSRMQARQHFGPGILDAQSKILAALKEAAIKGLENNRGLESGLTQAALAGMAGVKRAIAQVAPLKPSTIKARKREGFKGTKPLRRTGAYINSIKGIVRDR